MDNPSITVSANFKINLIAQMPLLKKFAKKFTTEREDIDDLVQDTLLKAMTASDKYQSGTNLRAWLWVLMKNIYINNYRKHKQHQRISEIEKTISCHFSTCTSYKNGGEEKLINTDIKKAMNQLKPSLYLSIKPFVLGYKYKEIANSLHIPLGTVKTRIFEARTHLKSLLTPYHLRK
ncbi:RNA polymerase sigma factor [Pedobacter sp. Du54]|uniref:RNA polymerase sigma factor n=1 Tax=Pedobacter anseongensis TaxID=3133439 RepID=UPI0030AAF82F